MSAGSQGALLWQPSTGLLENSRIARYMAWLARERNLPFEDYHALWRWSTTDLEGFWRSIRDHFGIPAFGTDDRVLDGRAMPGAHWFPGARLNFVDQVMRHARNEQPAIVFQSEHRPLDEWSWARLADRVARLAHGLRRHGIEPGDRIAAYMPNIPEAIALFLACASVGAVWSSCSPDMGAASVADRWRQIAPRLLFAVDGYRYGGKPHDRRGVVDDLVAQLPSIEGVIRLPYLDVTAPAPSHPLGRSWSDFCAEDAPLEVTPVPFDHPLWIVYSSGTSGMPKPIVHGHGGVALESVKGTGLHLDQGPGDRFFWLTTTGWIMWNSVVCAMATGATVLLYDGSPSWPDIGVLWRFAANARATLFGAGAAYLQNCMKLGLQPGIAHDLSALRTLGSTGSPLSPEAFHWVYEEVKSDVLLASISGGTDSCAAFVGGVPILPLYAGEMQCRCLGMAVQSFDDAGRARVGEVGELVITEPFPTMPLYFWNDPGGQRYHESYFDTYPGVWRHGDWIEITPRGGAIIYGRSDATINRQGVRIGTSELYRAIEGMPEIADSIVVDLEYLGRPSFMPLFVVLRSGMRFDDELKVRIKQAIRQSLTPRHVPDDVFAIDEVPRTLSGKKMELPVKKLLLGHAADAVASRDAMSNPGSLDWFIAYAGRLNGGRR